jgi:hypothetical protein
LQPRLPLNSHVFRQIPGICGGSCGGAGGEGSVQHTWHGLMPYSPHPDGAMRTALGFASAQRSLGSPPAIICRETSVCRGTHVGEQKASTLSIPSLSVSPSAPPLTTIACSGTHASCAERSSAIVSLVPPMPGTGLYTVAPNGSMRGPQSKQSWPKWQAGAPVTVLPPPPPGLPPGPSSLQTPSLALAHSFEQRHMPVGSAVGEFGGGDEGGGSGGSGVLNVHLALAMLVVTKSVTSTLRAEGTSTSASTLSVNEYGLFRRVSRSCTAERRISMPTDCSPPSASAATTFAGVSTARGWLMSTSLERLMSRSVTPPCGEKSHVPSRFGLISSGA